MANRYSRLAEAMRCAMDGDAGPEQMVGFVSVLIRDAQAQSMRGRILDVLNSMDGFIGISRRMDGYAALFETADMAIKARRALADIGAVKPNAAMHHGSVPRSEAERVKALALEMRGLGDDR